MDFRRLNVTLAPQSRALEAYARREASSRPSTTSSARPGRDPDAQDVIRGGPESKLGWYSQRAGEIGDIPMALAGADLSLVMQEVGLTSGATAPVQLEWSNAVHGPEAPVPAAT